MSTTVTKANPRSRNVPKRPESVDAPEERAAFWFLAPAVILLLLFLVVPVLMSFGLGFTNARLGSAYAPEFVGLAQFLRALTADPTFWAGLRNIAVFVFVVVPVQGGLGLVLALLVNQKLRGVTAFRVMFFMPVVTSMVVVAMLWRFMYQQDGLVNAIFGFNVDWLKEPSTALPAVIVMSIW